MTVLNPDEITVIQLALQTLIEDSEEVVNTFEIPWTPEARKNMREIGSAAKSALSKIQVKSGVSIGLGEFKDGDEKEFLTKQS